MLRVSPPLSEWAITACWEAVAPIVLPIEQMIFGIVYIHSVSSVLTRRWQHWHRLLIAQSLWHRLLTQENCQIIGSSFLHTNTHEPGQLQPRNTHLTDIGNNRSCGDLVGIGQWNRAGRDHAHATLDRVDVMNSDNTSRDSFQILYTQVCPQWPACAK